MALRTLVGCPVVYDIQDLWPDTVASSGMMGNRWIEAALARWCRLVYSQVDRIAVLSPGFRETLVRRGVAAEKIEVIYNWADEASLRCAGPDENVARRFGVAGRFNVVFAGTMGLVQKLDGVLEAARICAATVPDVQFVFVGGGVDKARLEQRAADMQLPNVRFLPRQPMETIGGILSAADALLVHLQDDPLFRITIPSKTQAYLATGRPIVMAVAGDAASLVERSGGGVICPPENPAALAEAVKRLRMMPRAEREAMGDKGRAFYDRHLSLAVGVEKFERLFEAAVQGRRSRRKGSGHGSRIASAPAGLQDRAA